MKKIFSLLLVLLFTLTITACGGNGENNNTGEETKQNSLLSVDINPSIEFVLDDEGKVVSFVFNNEDAEIAAANIDFVGLTQQEAIEQFINAAVEAGFVDIETNENQVIITASNPNEGEEVELQEEAERAAQAYLTENKIGAAVLDGAIVYEELAALAEQYEISIGKVRMIESVIASDETKTYEELASLPMEDLMDMITTSHRERMQEFVANKKTDALALKDQLILDVKAKVEAHRQAVEDGTAEAPDYEAIKADHLKNFDLKIEEYRAKADERRNGFELPKTPRN